MLGPGFAAYTDFTAGSLRLMVWYARELIYHRDPSVCLEEALDIRVDILRKTTAYDGRHPGLGLDPPNAEWERWKQRLALELQTHAGDKDPATLEDTCLAILWPLVEPTLQDSYARSRAFTTGQFGCWRYAYKPDPVPVIDLHFANAFVPESPFALENRQHAIGSLQDLLDQACSEHAKAQTVHCSSWLNQYPPFRTFFPISWAESFTPWEYSSGTAGHWGQYMDRHGAFHQNNGATLRKTGEHPYACGSSQCTLDELRQHLTNLAGA